MRISDWSSDVCSSDLYPRTSVGNGYNLRPSVKVPAAPGFPGAVRRMARARAVASPTCTLRGRFATLAAVASQGAESADCPRERPHDRLHRRLEPTALRQARERRRDRKSVV